MREIRLAATYAMAIFRLVNLLLVAALYLAFKYHHGDEGNGIFRNPDKAREIYEEIGESYEEYEKWE